MSDPAPARETLTPALRVWRSRALYSLLTVIAVAGLPAYVAPLINAQRQGGITPILWAYLGIYVAFVALALAPALPENARALGLMGLAYVNAIASLARLGLAGSGRLYLLVMPVVAALLLGARAGYVSAAVSLLIYIAFTYLAGSGQLATMLTQPFNPTSLADWLEAGLAFAVFLIVLAVLVERFAALLVTALRSQQRTSSELAYTARALREREEVLTRQKDTLAALHDTAVGVASARDTQGLLTALVERSVSLASAAYGWLYLVDREADVLVAAIGTGMFEKHVGLRLKRGAGLSGRIWAEARPLSVENYRVWDNRAGVFDGEPIGPAMGVPLYVEGQVMGVIGLTRLVYSKPFTADELDAMTRLAELAGILLTNARLRGSLEQELAARVEAQAALQTAYDDLDQRVQARTAELAAAHNLERERRAEAERARRVADGLREIVAALNAESMEDGTGALADTLDFIVSHACRMLRSDAAAIFKLETAAGGEQALRTQTLRVEAGCGLTPEFIEAASLPYPDSIAGRALREGRAIPAPDIRRQLELMSDDLAPSPYLQRPEMKQLMTSFAAMLLSPLTIGRQPYGVMALYYRKPRPFTEEDVAEAQSLADQTALAIESAWLREQAGEAAALDERNRLARELHDSVTQSLYSVTLYAEAAARQLEAGNTPATVEHLRELRDTSRDALREMRLLIYELRPPEIERTGLAAALRGRLQAVETRGGVRAELIQDGDENIPAAVQQELYHIAREALNNSLKHSLATRLTVRLLYRPHETALEVEDDGAGFDSVEAMEAGGMGMRTMRERSQRLGAELEIRTAKGQGTLVRVRIKN